MARVQGQAAVLTEVLLTSFSFFEIPRGTLVTLKFCDAILWYILLQSGLAMCQSFFISKEFHAHIALYAVVTC